MKLNHVITPLDNPNQIKETKKTIARLKTELSSRKKEEGNK
jgi:ribosomal protein L29